MTKTKKRTIISVIIIILVAVVTILLFRFINHQEDTEPTPDTPDATTSVPAIEEDEKEEELPTTTDPVPEENQDNATIQYEGTNPNNEGGKTIDAVLTYYGLQGKEYIVNINIAQYITGTCDLTLGSYTGSVTIDQGASTSACSFHIAPSSLQSGQQRLVVQIKGNGRTGRVEENIDVSL